MTRPLRLWNLEDGRSQALEGHSDTVTGAVLLEDSKRALSWSADSTLRLWDLEKALEGHSDSVMGALISGRREARHLLVRLQEYYLPLGSRQKPENRSLRDTEVRSEVLCSQTTASVPSRGLSTSLSAFGISTTARARPSNDDTVVRSKVSCSRTTGSAPSIGSITRISSAFGILTKAQSQTLERHGGWVRGVALSSDGKHAISCLRTTNPFAFGISTTPEQVLVGRHRGWVLGAMLLEDSKRALSWSADSTLRLWISTTARASLVGHKLGRRRSSTGGGKHAHLVVT